MSNFHYGLMQHLDNVQKSGTTFTPAHAGMREALRRANMKAMQFANVEDLIAFVQGFRPWLPAEQIRAAQAS